MLKRERLRNILEIVTDRKFVTVDELAKTLQVSDMTTVSYTHLTLPTKA